MKVVYRKQWDAKPPNGRTLLDPAAILYLVVHYSAMDADEARDHRDCPARVRGIQRYHMSPTPADPTKPWSDIAYNWLICPHGAIFRGRGWCVRSAATGPANGYSVAACVLGDDSPDEREANPAVRQALRDIYAFVDKRAPDFRGARGHRDFMGTPCPGNELYRFLKTL